MRNLPAPTGSLAAEDLIDEQEQSYWAAILGVVVRSGDRQTVLHSSCTKYAIYHGIARVIQPQSILEIGVGFGYSLASLACGARLTENVFGIDSEVMVNGSNLDAQARLLKLGVEADLLCSSASSLRARNFARKRTLDLIHIDAGRRTSEVFEYLEGYSSLAERLLITGAFLPSVWNGISRFLASRRKPVSVSFFCSPDGIALVQL